MKKVIEIKNKVPLPFPKTKISPYEKHKTYIKPQKSQMNVKILVIDTYIHISNSKFHGRNSKILCNLLVIYQKKKKKKLCNKTNLAHVKERRKNPPTIFMNSKAQNFFTYIHVTLK